MEGLKNKLSEVEAFVQRQREKTFLKLCEFSSEQTVLSEGWVLILRDFLALQTYTHKKTLQPFRNSRRISLTPSPSSRCVSAR